MSVEEIARARKLIEESKVLSAVEKAEWVQLLPEMNLMQVDELITILLGPKVDEVFANPLKEQRPAVKESTSLKGSLPPWLSSVDLNEKELPVGIPENELEITAPHPAVQVPKVPNAPTLENVIKAQEPKNTARRIQEHNEVRPVTPTPPVLSKTMPSNAPVVPKSQSVTAQSAIIPPVPKPPVPVPVPKPTPGPVPQPSKIVIKSLSDFSALTPAMLHGNDLTKMLQGVLNATAELTKKNDPYKILENIEQSLLYKTYVKMGIDLLNNPDSDREGVFQQIIERNKAKGDEYLTKLEFEAFADFRRELDKLWV